LDTILLLEFTARHAARLARGAYLIERFFLIARIIAVEENMALDVRRAAWRDGANQGWKAVA
jgi:hypothetical protein